jgi:hypothetical protein
LHNSSIIAIFAGSERRLMNEMFFSDKRPFFQSATLLQLEPIDLNVYTDFAVSQFKAAEKCIEPEAVTWAYQTYNGVTMYVHKLLHDCYAETKAGETCDIAAMKNASEQLILQNSKRLQELLAFVTEQQKEVLYAIASDGYVSRITSSDFVKRHHLKSASAVQSATKRLLDLDLITEQHKSYLMPIPPMWYEMRILRNAVTLAVLLMRPLRLKVVFFFIFRLVFMRLNIIFANGGAVHLNGGAV